MRTVGIDSGSTTTKTALIVEGGLKDFVIIRTGANSFHAAQRCFDSLLERNGLNAEDIDRIVATGYGRRSISFANSVITEISCHAKGVAWEVPEAKVIIDIGGQDSKVIKVDKAGKVLDFRMNDKCAAGTGRFLEVMSRALEIELEEFSRMSLGLKKRATVSSMCTVFAESEIISHVASGIAVAEIIAGLHDSVAKRVAALGQRFMTSDVEKVILTGGVAKNKGMIEALEQVLQRQVVVPGEPQIIGALGAGLYAMESTS